MPDAELTPEEAQEFARRQTMTYFGMTPDEFRDAVSQGVFDGNTMALHVAMIVGGELPVC